MHLQTDRSESPALTLGEQQFHQAMLKSWGNSAYASRIQYKVLFKTTCISTFIFFVFNKAVTLFTVSLKEE